RLMTDRLIRSGRSPAPADEPAHVGTSVAVQKFAIPNGQNRSELLNQSHTSKSLSASVPLNPKFATECAAKSSELRIRDTSRFAPSEDALVVVEPVKGALR